MARAAAPPTRPAHLLHGHGHPAPPWDFEDTLECWRVQVTHGLPTDDERDDEPAVETPEPVVRGSRPPSACRTGAPGHRPRTRAIFP
ncbi:hypothetical protein ABZW03_27780 [Kitasatospora sp. NPDC004799]|uniref:hypothetical protein n=1 Tax=Kitasatospora sp. NPDC004799 TaxID=3154460 RepID=UPI0033B474E3